MHSTPWPQRPLLFTVLGTACALGLYSLIDNIKPLDDGFAQRIALAVAMSTFCLVFAVVSRRDRWPGATLFSLTAAGVVAGISYWRIHIDWPHAFNFMALVVALFIAAPFYQASLHTQWRNYRALHHHAWSNAVIIPLGLLFVALTFAMAYLLAKLFELVGISQLQDWLRMDITPWLLSGAALGASLGALREHDNIIASSQKLVQTVFSLLATPLAIGLGGFLLVLPFTGLDTLWNNTRNTSATLFACALAALVFANAVVRDDADNQSHSRILQLAARLLAVCLAPLALITALAIRLRVEQYGWTPDRLWATVISSLLLCYGLWYLVSALRRLQFNESIRQANTVLALLVCALATVLATPLFEFGKVSVKDQLARLNDGRVSEDKFDVAAMAFDYGPAGRNALAELKETATPELVTRMEKVLAAGSRRAANIIEQQERPDISSRIIVMNGSGIVPTGLADTIQRTGACTHEYCYLFLSEKERDAVLLNQLCMTDKGENCRPDVQRYRLHGTRWSHEYHNNKLHEVFEALPDEERPGSTKAFNELLNDAVINGKFELRPVQRQQVFINGVPVGPTLP